MSGFDVAAGAAGIVSLGFQLIETSIKLNRIVKAVKDAPRTVEKLVEELKTMGMFLQHIQQDHQYCPPSGAILDQCLVIFQHSTFELRELVDKMETCLAKRPRLGGKLYVAYKDHDIKELLGDLERAKTSLGFAFKMHCDEIQRQQRQTSLIALTQLVTTENANISRQLSPIAEATTELRRLQSMMSESQRQRNQAYTTALAQVASETADISRQLKAFTEYSAELRQIHSIMSRTTSQALADLSSTGCKIDISCETTPIKRQNTAISVKAQRKGAETRYQTWKLRLPTWLCRRVLDVTFSVSCSPWTIYTYNFLPADSSIFRLCERGNLQGVRKLIESGMASPLDIRSAESVFFDRKHNAGSWETLVEVAILFLYRCRIGC